MARQLGALTVLREDQGWMPRTPQRLATVCNSSSGGSDALFWPPWALYICGAQTYIQAGKTLINIKYNKSKRKKLKNKTVTKPFNFFIIKGTKEEILDGWAPFQA